MTFFTKVLVNGHSIDACVFDGVFISTIQIFVVRLDSKSEQFFVCYNNSMDEFKLKLFELSVVADVFQRLENLAPSITILIDFGSSVGGPYGPRCEFLH